MESSQQNNKASAIVEIKSQSFFQGPLPPPELLAKYEAISSGLADRITAMAEENGKHRRRMEWRMLTLSVVSNFSGQVFAFVVVITGIFAGVYLLTKDKPVSGLISMIVSLAPVAYRFIHFDKRSRKTKGDKEEQENKIP